MPIAHRFGATNEPGTCLWCGDELKPNYDRGETVTTWEHGVTEFGDEYNKPIDKHINKKVRGYGWEDNGMFCTLRCGEAFGKAFARMGRRLEPKK